MNTEFINTLNHLRLEVILNPFQKGLIYEAANRLISEEIDNSAKNRKITKEEASIYKKVTEEIIYRTPRQTLTWNTTRLLNSIQEKIMGLETLMGLPQRKFASPIYDLVVRANSKYMNNSLEESRKYLQSIGITEEFIKKKIRRGDFKKEDLVDKRVPELIASIANDGFFDLFDKLPYPFYTLDEREPVSKGKIKKIFAVGSLLLLYGISVDGYLEHADPLYHFKGLIHRYKDINGNGIDDSWEISNGFSILSLSNAKKDPDKDGYSNYKEYLLGLDPHNPDCDHDGLKDGGDPDHDNMSSWFERNIMNTDPLTPNDRYVILANPIYFNYGGISDLMLKLINYKLDEQYEFFHDKMKIPRKNIIDLRYPYATLENFTKACKEISNISDGNDLVYIILNGHGNNMSFSFDKGDNWRHWMYYDELEQILNNIPSKAQYVQISSCHSGSAIKCMNLSRIHSVPINFSFDEIPDKYIDLFSKLKKDFQKPIAEQSPPRVVVTSSSQEETTHWFPFIDFLYPAVISKPEKLYLNLSPIVYSILPFTNLSSIHDLEVLVPVLVMSSPDKNGDHFVSIKEAFQSLKEKQLSMNSQYPYLFLTSTPQSSDPYNISSNFYFGEYVIK